MPNVHFPRPSDGKRLVAFDWMPIRYRNVITVLKNPFYAAPVQIPNASANRRSTTSLGSSSQNNVPYFGRGSTLRVDYSEFELILSDAMHQLDSPNGNRGIAKSFEPEHWFQSKFDGSMVLFNSVI